MIGTRTYEVCALDRQDRAWSRWSAWGSGTTRLMIGLSVSQHVQRDNYARVLHKARSCQHCRPRATPAILNPPASQRTSRPPHGRGAAFDVGRHDALWRNQIRLSRPDDRLDSTQRLWASSRTRCEALWVSDCRGREEGGFYHHTPAAVQRPCSHW